MRTGKHNAQSLAVDPITKNVYTGGKDRAIRIWNIKKGVLVKSLSDHRAPVGALAINSSGELLVSGGKDGQIRIWRMPRHNILARIQEAAESIEALAFHPSNQYFAWICETGKVKVWDINGEKVIAFRQIGADKADVLAFNATGNTVATTATENSIVLWDWRADKLVAVLSGHEKRITGVSFHPQGKTILSCSLDGAIKLWNIEQKSMIANLHPGRKPVVGCSFSSDGKRVLAVFRRNFARTWALGDKGFLASLKGHTDSIVSLDIAKNGSSLISASLDNRVKVWDIGNSKRKQLRDYPVPAHKVQQIRFAPDNIRFVTAGANAEIRIWDRRKKSGDKTLYTVLKGHRGKINTVDFHPHRNLLISGGADKTIFSWDVDKQRPVFKNLAHDAQITDIRFSPAGEKYASGSLDRTVKIWNTKNHRLLHTLKAHKRGIRKLAFSKDGKKLASAADDKTIVLWELSSGKPIHSMSGHDFVLTGIRFSENGKILISSSRDGTVRLWNVENGAFIKTLTGEVDQITSIATSNSIGLLAIGSLNADIALLNLPTKYFKPPDGKKREDEKGKSTATGRGESAGRGQKTETPTDSKEDIVIVGDILTKRVGDAKDSIFEPTLEEVDQDLISLQSRLNRVLKNRNACENPDAIQLAALRIQQKIPNDRAFYYAMMRVFVAKMDLQMVYVMNAFGTDTVLDETVYDFGTDAEVGEFFDDWNERVFEQMALTGAKEMEIEFADCNSAIREMVLPTHIVHTGIPRETVKKVHDRQVVIDFRMFAGLDPKLSLFRDRLYALIEAVEDLPGDKRRIRTADLGKYMGEIRSSPFGYVVVDLSKSQQWSSNDERPTFQLKMERQNADSATPSFAWRTYHTTADKTRRLLLRAGNYYLKFHNRVHKTFSFNRANQEIRFVIE